MIKDNIDFEYTINQLINYVEPEESYQREFLDSDKMNHAFEEIEKALNTLYEKTRYLEDAIQYARVFLDAKTKEFNDEMSSVIKELEKTLDMSKNLSYLSYNVALKNNNRAINDRFVGSDKISPLIVKDNVLTMGYEYDTEIAFSDKYTVSDSISFDNNLDKIVKDKTYKAIFLEEKLVKDGLTETMVLYFPKPVTINVVDLVPSNCNIKNVRFGLINGIEEYAADYKLSMNNVARTCTYVKFDMVCTNYNTIIYEIDKSMITDNLWNDLKKYEVARTTDLNKVSKLNAEYIISRTTVNKITGKTQKENLRSSVNKQIVTLKMYSYVFGLDTIKFKFVKPNTVGYFISNDINLGRMESIDYITLTAEHVQDANCAIEYSILDGEIEKPILPIGIDIVENEPIIAGQNLRFERDLDRNSDSYVQEIIKKDGQLVNITYEDALKMTDGQYTITYKPKGDNHKLYGIINESIKIKCYMRTFGTHIVDVSYIDLITIRKYGEDSVWINKY